MVVDEDVVETIVGDVQFAAVDIELSVIDVDVELLTIEEEIAEDDAGRVVEVSAEMLLLVVMLGAALLILTEVVLVTVFKDDE